MLLELSKMTSTFGVTPAVINAGVAQYENAWARTLLAKANNDTDSKRYRAAFFIFSSPFFSP